MFAVESDQSNPYAPLIESMVSTAFPESTKMDCCQIMEAVSNEIVATGQTRYGPAPSPEGAVRIRQVVADSMRMGAPIPFLVPWGSVKTASNESVDIAELMALRMLGCLNRRVIRYYEPGIEIRIRLEDVGGLWLFADNPATPASTIHYCGDMTDLVKVLNLGCINVVKESDIVSIAKYEQMCMVMMSPMIAYLSESNGDESADELSSIGSFRELNRLGWMGSIPTKQRTFYYKRYRALYGEENISVIERLARYFCGSWARYQCEATGLDPKWSDRWIQLNFANPVPGAPKKMADKVIHYRTMPAKYTRDHNPPWRVKGYLRIDNDNSVRPGLASWKTELNYDRFSTTLVNGENKVSIQTDYIIT